MSVNSINGGMKLDGGGGCRNENETRRRMRVTKRREKKLVSGVCVTTGPTGSPPVEWVVWTRDIIKHVVQECNVYMIKSAYNVCYSTCTTCS